MKNGTLPALVLLPESITKKKNRNRKVKKQSNCPTNQQKKVVNYNPGQNI